MRYKLDMLEPATKIFRFIALFAILAVFFFFTKYTLIAITFSILSIFLIFIVLAGVAIELKQDDCLQKKHEMNKNKVSQLVDTYECEYCGIRYKTKREQCPGCGRDVLYLDKKGNAQKKRNAHRR